MGVHALHHRIGGNGAGIKDKGIGGRPKWRQAALTIILVAFDDLGQQRLFIDLLALAAQLGGTAMGDGAADSDFALARYRAP